MVFQWLTSYIKEMQKNIFHNYVSSSNYLEKDTHSASRRGWEIKKEKQITPTL